MALCALLTIVSAGVGLAPLSQVASAATHGQFGPDAPQTATSPDPATLTVPTTTPMPAAWHIAPVNGVCPATHAPTLNIADAADGTIGWNTFINANSSYKDIVFPAGCYYVDGTVSGVALTISNADNVVLDGHDGSGGQAVIIQTGTATTVDSTLMRISGTSDNVEVQNLVLRGAGGNGLANNQPAYSGGGGLSGIQVEGATNTWLLGDTIEGFHDDGVYVSYDTQSIVIAGDFIGRVGRDAISLGNANDIIVLFNTLWDSGQYAVDVEPNSGFATGTPAFTGSGYARVGTARASLVANTLSGAGAELHANTYSQGYVAASGSTPASYAPMPFVDDLNINGNTWTAACVAAPGELCDPTDPAANPMRITLGTSDGTMQRVEVQGNKQLGSAGQALIQGDSAGSAGPNGDMEFLTMINNSTVGPTASYTIAAACPSTSSGNTYEPGGVVTSMNPGQPSSYSSAHKLAPEVMSAVQVAERHYPLIWGRGPTSSEALATRNILWGGLTAGTALKNMMHTANPDFSGTSFNYRTAQLTFVWKELGIYPTWDNLYTETQLDPGTSRQLVTLPLAAWELAVAGGPLLTDDNPTFIHDLFVNLFGPAGSPSLEPTYLAELTKGASRPQVVADIAQDSTVRSTEEHTTEVWTTYMGVLGRIPTSAQLANRVGQLDNGTYTETSLINAFVATDEYATDKFQGQPFQFLESPLP